MVDIKKDIIDSPTKTKGNIWKIIVIGLVGVSIVIGLLFLAFLAKLLYIAAIVAAIVVAILVGVRVYKAIKTKKD